MPRCRKGAQIPIQAQGPRQLLPAPGNALLVIRLFVDFAFQKEFWVTPGLAARG